MHEGFGFWVPGTTRNLSKHAGGGGGAWHGPVFVEYCDLVCPLYFLGCSGYLSKQKALRHAGAESV